MIKHSIELKPLEITHFYKNQLTIMLIQFNTKVHLLLEKNSH